jgi:hypothetical protein
VAAVTVSLVLCALAPHLLFMALCDGGPPAVYGLGTPDQGASQGPSWPPTGGDQFQHNELRTRQHKHICRKSEPWGGLLQK